MPPTVSVIIPTFQRRDFVQRAVASALAQSYRDFEVLVVDDGSTDGTREALAFPSDRLRYVWQENRGTAAARNAGIELARGEILAFLDSDDRWLPRHLDVLVRTLDRHPSAVLASTSPGFLAVGRAEPEDAELADPLPELLIANNVGYVSCVGVRRSALAAVGRFTEGLEPAEYTDLIVRLALQGPFALVRRRTAVLQATRGAMLDRGRRRGQYLQALAAIAERTATDTRDHPLGRRAEGASRFFDALQALDAAEIDRARQALVEACRLFPELSNEPVLVGRQLLNALPGADRAADRLASFRTMAELWPDPRSDTAVALRSYAVICALRAGQLREATRLVKSLSLRDAPLALQRRNEIVETLRRAASRRIHRDRESVHVARAIGLDGDGRGRPPGAAASRGRPPE